MEENKKEELNYKRACACMYDNISELIRQMIELQRKTENIWLNDPSPYEPECKSVDALDIVQEIIDAIREKEKNEKSRHKKFSS